MCRTWAISSGGVQSCQAWEGGLPWQSPNPVPLGSQANSSD